MLPGILVDALHLSIVVEQSGEFRVLAQHDAFH